MRQCAEDQLDIAERRVIGSDEREIASADAHGRASLFVRGGEGKREGRVPLDERTELAAGIAAGPEHANWNLIHA
jgi:hypothetical protein